MPWPKGKSRKAPEPEVGGAVRTATAQGWGESKRFGGGLGDGRDWSKLTCQGMPVPEHMWATMPYVMTDQGAAEANAGKEPRRVSILRDGTPYDQVVDEKKLDKYRDDLLGQLDIAPDPMAALMKRYTPVGHRGLFVGKRKTDEAGMLRGPIEYTLVSVKDEETGQMRHITCGGMTLASVPEEMARAAEAYAARLSRETQISINEQVDEKIDRVMSERGLADMARRKRVTDMLGGAQVEEDERADSELLRDDVDRRTAPVDERGVPGVFHE